jgi:hypothetical protein
MHHNKIVRITEAGEVSDFVKQDVYDRCRWAACTWIRRTISVWCATGAPDHQVIQIVRSGTGRRISLNQLTLCIEVHDLRTILLSGIWRNLYDRYGRESCLSFRSKVAYVCGAGRNKRRTRAPALLSERHYSLGRWQRAVRRGQPGRPPPRFAHE